MVSKLINLGLALENICFNLGLTVTLLFRGDAGKMSRRGSCRCLEALMQVG